MGEAAASMNTLHHFLITRFSFRGKDVFKAIDGPTFLRAEDPLDPQRLKHRFKLFEFTCLPSVLGQTEQNFCWIILVDGMLPAHYHARLAALIQPKSRAYIHVFDPQQNLAELGWLGRYLPPDGYVITTNFDDDDCIPKNYIAALHRHLVDLDGRAALTPVGIIGAKSALEWDLLPCALAPLGWKAPWHRSRWVLSVGFSLYCKIPEFDLCILGLRHTLAERYLDFTQPPVSLNALWFQRTVAQTAQANNLDWRSWQPTSLFHDISEEVGAVLLANHDGNDQATRLLEEKAQRTPVTGESDFPAFSIDWQKARAFAESLNPRA
jgi:hypothetical protein